MSNNIFTSSPKKWGLKGTEKVRTEDIINMHEKFEKIP